MMSLDGEYASHRAVSVFRNPQSIKKEPASQPACQQPAGKRRFLPFSFFLMFPPSFPNSCERDSVFVVVIPPARLLSIPLGSLPEMEKAIMASVWITTDYNNGGGGGG